MIENEYLCRAASKAMTFPVPLQYKAIEALVSEIDSDTLMQRFEEEGLIERLVNELKEGASNPHLKSISTILGYMLETTDFLSTVPEGLLFACTAIMKEEVENSESSSHIFSLLIKIINHFRDKAFVDVGGLKWFCKHMMKGDKARVEKGMASLLILVANVDSETMHAMANEAELIDLLEKSIADSSSSSILTTSSIFIFGHLAMRCNIPIKPTLMEFLVRPLLEILKTPDSPSYSTTTIQLLVELMNHYPTKCIVSA